MIPSVKHPKIIIRGVNLVSKGIVIISGVGNITHDREDPPIIAGIINIFIAIIAVKSVSEVLESGGIMGRLIILANIIRVE